MEELIIVLLRNGISLIISVILEIAVVGACLDVNNNKEIGYTFNKIIKSEKI